MKRWFLFCMFLGGCVSIPQKEMGKIAPPPSLETSLQTAFESESFHPGEWPSSNWWEMFDDPQLNRLIVMALQDNPSLKQAEARVNFAKYSAKEKRAFLFPQLDARYEESWEHLSKNGLFRFAAPTFPAVINLIDIALDFQYEFDFWGKNSNLFKAALGIAQAEMAEYAEAKLVLTTGVCNTYFDLQANLEKLKIMKEIAKDRRSLLELIKERFDHGLDTDIQTLGAATDLFDTERSILHLEAAVALSRHLLNALVGLNPEIEHSIEATTEGIYSFPLPEVISLDLLARRPDLMAQIWRVEAAAHEINAAKTNFYPNINLSATGGFEGISFNTVFKPSSLMGALSPAIHLPIFTAGRIRAQLDKKVALFDEAVYAYNTLLLKAAQDVADQLVSFAKINQQVDVQKKSLDAKRQTYILKFLRFSQGVSNYLSVLEAEQSLLEQRFIRTDLVHEQLKATVKLIKALGGGYD